MALNLSTLTSPSTSDDVLSEILTTADFLEPVPVLRNLARGSNKGGDAKQAVALNQPKALPLIDGDGYLYCPTATSNYASVENPIIPATADFDLSVEFVVAKFASGTGYSHIVSQYQGNTSGRVYFGFYDHQKRLYFFCGGDGTNPNVDIKTSVDAIVEGQRHTARVTRVGNTFTLYLDGVLQQTATSGVATLQTVGTQIGWGSLRGLNGAIFSVTEGSNTNIDFTSTNVRHGATKFKCATGQTVTINQSGNDPATIIKKPVLRFDGADDFMDGVLGQTITGGYMFAAFSVLGSGGDNLGRVFSVNSTGADDYNTSGAIFSLRNSNSLFSYFNTDYEGDHTALFDDANGDILHESLITNGTQLSRVNNADEASTSEATTISAEEFNVGASRGGVENTSIDLEYLALFPSLTDSQADAVRSYINNRNSVFLRHDTDGYYFYDPQSLADGAVTSWNGRIIGSDNGDTDKLATQATAADQPTSDGYKVTFADNTDHFDISQVTLAAGDSYAWMVCGTSLGTFAYKVTVSGETELTLLGHLGDAAYRKAGNLYGVILLPESATGRQINEAKKLLTDRGASMSAAGDITHAWRGRSDIVQFDGGDMSDVTNTFASWYSCPSLTSFSSNLPSVTNAGYAWFNCQSLKSFSIELPLATRVDNAWYGCSSLTSFNAPLPLVTDAYRAWSYCTSLTSFSSDLPLVTNALNGWRGCASLESLSTALPSATDVSHAWRDCSSLTSFSSDLSLATGVSSAWRDCSSLESFSTALPSATSANYAWYRCTSLTSFSSTLPSVTNLYQAWQGCTSLTDFSSDVFSNWNPSSISSRVFDTAWVNCPLTAQSVENILTSIDASGKYATYTGLSGGTALADAGIDIDYNVSTGSLSAATNAAVTSLKSKGWSIIVNNVTL